MDKSLWFFATMSLALVCSLPCGAQESVELPKTRSATKLTGGVDYSEPLRIQRSPGWLKGAASAVQNKATTPVPGKPLEGLLDTFSQSPAPIRVSRPQRARVTAVQPPMLKSSVAASAPKDNGYIWQVSRNGGYYECQNRLPGLVVPGRDLWKYGGVFANGARVPKGPVSTNIAKHVWRAGTY